MNCEACGSPIAGALRRGRRFCSRKCASTMRASCRAGDVFGHWTVLAPSVEGSVCARVRCVCGAEALVPRSNLYRGMSRSCGCRRWDLAAEKFSKRERWRSIKQHRAEYRIWNDMKTRCYNANSTHYADYGGRGIAICGRWLSSFEDFFSDIGPRPSPEHSIDRIDVNGNYEPSNCRWATQYEQTRNKRNTVKVEFNGQSVPLWSLAEQYNIPTSVVIQRLGRGWRVEDALAATRYPSRIDEDVVRKIRALAAEGVTFSEIGRRLSLGKSTVRRIARGMTRKEVA